MDITALLEKFDIVTLLAIGAVWWNLKNHVDQRFDKVDEKITDIDRRLCRLEGAFSSKDCCMIKDERQLKKTEGEK